MQHKHITVIGDSTIDNKVWVAPGLYGNAIRGKLGIQRDSSATRIAKSNKKFSRVELSVVEHLQKKLPE